LKVVQAVGPLKAKFPKSEGWFCLANELLVTPGDSPLFLTVVRFRKQFIENLPYGDDSLGQAQVVDLEEEVRKRGGILEWGEDENGKRIPPTWVPLGRALVVIPAPEELKDEPLFCYEDSGKKFAVALWTLRGTSYSTVAKSIMTAAGFALKPENGGLSSGLWEATTKYEKRGINMVHVPYIRFAKSRNSDEFKKFCQEITKI
jgi:hypothetical protein